MARLTPHFSSNRAVREYTEKFYLPAAEGYRKRAENNGALAKQIVDWRASLRTELEQIGIWRIKNRIEKDQHHLRFRSISTIWIVTAVKVELYSAAMTKEMEYLGPDSQFSNGHIYRVEVPAAASGIQLYPPNHTLFSRRCYSTRITLKSYGRGK